MIPQPQLWRRAKIMALPICLILVSLLPISELPAAQAQEPSPIEIELVAPEQAAPGQVILVLIKYNAVDMNANADMNYNLVGPAHVATRIPEPPNPAFNAWHPTETGPGVIRMEIVVHDDAAGQSLTHQVEVKWGPKYRKFEAKTAIQHAPPTPTPTSTPRPTSKPAQTPPPAATSTPPSPPNVGPDATPVSGTLQLTSLSFAGSDGRTIQNARTNQDVALALSYQSNVLLENVALHIRFDPNVINLGQGWYTGQEYVLALAELPAAPNGASLFPMPIWGHIRPHLPGGGEYPLYAVARIEVSANSPVQITQQVVTQTLRIAQTSLLEVQVSAETTQAQSGSSVILHVTCVNGDPVPATGIQLKVAGLPEGFTVSPEVQIIDAVAENGGSVEHLFTVRIPDAYVGTAILQAIAAREPLTETIQSAPLYIQVAAPAHFALDMTLDKSAARAGETLYANVTCQNTGQIAAQDVKVRLVDTAGGLAVQQQDLGSLAAGESKKMAFVVQIPQDFAAAQIVLLAEATAADGTAGQSQPAPVSVTCIPVANVSIVSAPSSAQEGQPFDVIVRIDNVSLCNIKDVSVSLINLPGAPPAQIIAELPAGASRHALFTIPTSRGQKQVSLSAQIGYGEGNRAESQPVTVAVGGVSTVLIVIFVLLVLVSIVAIIVGVALYLRNK